MNNMSVRKLDLEGEAVAENKENKKSSLKMLTRLVTTNDTLQ